MCKGEIKMKAWIDRDGCISCGLCASICPDVFRMDDEDIAEVYVDEIPEEVEDMAQEAADSCPVSVIHIEED
jgi:ferredoxin